MRKLWLGANAAHSCSLVIRNVDVTAAHVSCYQLGRVSWTSSTGLAQAPRRLGVLIEAGLHRESLYHFWGSHLPRGSWSSLWLVTAQPTPSWRIESPGRSVCSRADFFSSLFCLAASSTVAQFARSLTNKVQSWMTNSFPHSCRSPQRYYHPLSATPSLRQRRLLLAPKWKEPTTLCFHIN